MTAFAAASRRDITPWRTGASVIWLISVWAGLNAAAALCAT